MNINDLRTLYDYNYWANKRVLDAAAEVSPEHWAAPLSLSYGSLGGTLVHILVAEWIWRMRCQEGISPISSKEKGEINTLDLLIEEWRKEEGLMRGYVRVLRGDDLTRKIKYKSTRGIPYENVLWHILVHLVNHGTQHRSEAAMVLTDYGYSPGDIDFIVYLREAK